MPHVDNLALQGRLQPYASLQLSVLTHAAMRGAILGNDAHHTLRSSGNNFKMTAMQVQVQCDHVLTPCCFDSAAFS